MILAYASAFRFEVLMETINLNVLLPYALGTTSYWFQNVPPILYLMLESRVTGGKNDYRSKFQKYQPIAPNP